MLRALVCLIATGFPVAAQTLTPDLKLVPTNALGFAHLKLGDVWKGDAVKDFRDVLALAGPKAFEHLDKEFHPPISSIDRITSVLIEIEPRNPMYMTILSFNTPYDSQRIAKEYFRDPKPKKAGTKEYLNDSPMNLAVYFADKQTLIVSNGKTMERYLTRAPNEDGPLLPLLAVAGKNPLTLGMLPSAFPIPKEELDRMPANMSTLFKAKTLMIAADNQKAVRLTASMTFTNADGAKDGFDALQNASKMVRQSQPWKEFKKEVEDMVYDPQGQRKVAPNQPRKLADIQTGVMGLFGLAGFNWADRQLQNLPVKQTGDTLTMEISLPTYLAPFWDMAIASASILQFTAQMAVIQSSNMMSKNNLKQIGLGIQNYDSAQGRLPAQGFGKNGKSMLSWRVAILPYMEEDNLYNSFKHDEPWDSEHNKKLIPKMPKVYLDPRIEEGDRKPGMTYYKVFAGKDAIFNTPQNWSVASLTSSPRGTWNLIFVAVGGDPVIWTKPEDFEYSETKAIPDLSKPFPELMVLIGDGSVKQLNPKMKDFDKYLRAYVNPNSTSTLTFRE